MAGEHSHEGTHLLSSFPVIFFGSLAIAGIIAFILHNRLKGLPKIGEKYYDPIVSNFGNVVFSWSANRCFRPHRRRGR